MNKANCGWLEEEVVDLALGKLAPHKHRELTHHIERCYHCAAVFGEWQLMLQDCGENLAPSPVLKHRLMRRVWLWTKLASWKKRMRLLPVVSAAVACAFILLIGSLLWPYDRTAPESAQTVKAEILKQNALVNDPQTVLHLAEPVVPAKVKGYVWVNDASDEMLLLAEGLDRLAEKDYQVWFVIGNDRSKVGVLQWRGQMAHLYFHGKEIRQVHDIAVSIEPKGGNFAPTGPDAMIVKIRHGR